MLLQEKQTGFHKCHSFLRLTESEIRNHTKGQQGQFRVIVVSTIVTTMFSTWEDVNTCKVFRAVLVTTQ